MKKKTEFAKLLESLDITGSQLARRVDVTRACVSKWVQGQATPNSNEMFIKIAKALNVSVETIVRCFFKY